MLPEGVSGVKFPPVDAGWRECCVRATFGFEVIVRERTQPMMVFDGRGGALAARSFRSFVERASQFVPLLLREALEELIPVDQDVFHVPLQRMLAFHCRIVRSCAVNGLLQRGNHSRKLGTFQHQVLDPGSIVDFSGL